MREPPLPVLIQFASKRFFQAAEERLQEAGLATLHPPEGQILAVLHSHPEMSASGVQEALKLSKSTVSEALNHLASLGLIEYVVNEENRREKRIVETEKGKRHQEQAWRVLSELEKETEKGLNQEELAVLRKALNQIIENTKGGNHG